MTLDLKKDREIVQAALESQPIFKDDGPSALLYSEWARKQQYCSRTFNPAHALEYVDTVEKQARAISDLMDDITLLYGEIAHGDNEHRGWLGKKLDKHFNRSLTQAREILGDPVVSEKGDE